MVFSSPADSVGVGVSSPIRGVPARVIVTASRNINVNAIAPGYIETEMTKKIDEKFKEKIEKY